MNDRALAALTFIFGIMIGIALIMIVWSAHVDSMLKTRFFVESNKLYHISEVHTQ